MQKAPLVLPESCKALLGSGWNMALGTGKSCPICKMSLFLMSNEIVRGVSVSLREQIILEGGSILTSGVWLALLTTEDPALVTQRGPLSLVGLGDHVTALDPFYYLLVSHAVSQQTVCKVSC